MLSTTALSWLLVPEPVSAGGGQIEYYQDTASASQTCNGTSCSGGAGWYDMPTTDVSIASSNFTVGEDYLILAWGSSNNGNLSGRSGLRIQHGSTGFTESQTLVESDRTNPAHKNPYFWFTVWTAVSGEDITMQGYYDNTYDALYEDLTLVAINAEDLIAYGDL